MLTLFSYVLPATLFLLGVMGLLSGYIPFMTRRPITGWQIRAVSVLLLIPLPISIWLGTRQPYSAGPLDRLAEAQQFQEDRLREAATLAAEKEEERIVGMLEDARESLKTESVPARDELERITESLLVYERFFDRQFVSLMALLIAVAVVPITKPFPRERATPEEG